MSDTPVLRHADLIVRGGRIHTLDAADTVVSSLAVAASLAWLVIGPDLPRFVRESLRLAPAVRAARPLEPRALPGPVDAGPGSGPGSEAGAEGRDPSADRPLSARRRPPRPAPPRRRPSRG